MAETPPLLTIAPVVVPPPFVKARPAINCNMPLPKPSYPDSPLGVVGNCHSGISVGLSIWYPNPSSGVNVI